MPNRGRELINRRIHGYNRLGDVRIKKLHFFEIVGRPSFFWYTRTQLSQALGACTVGKFGAGPSASFRHPSLQRGLRIIHTSTRRLRARPLD